MTASTSPYMKVYVDLYLCVSLSLSVFVAGSTVMVIIAYEPMD